MKTYRNNSVWSIVARITALLLIACSFSAQATAPRLTAKMFGDEKKADIVAYQSVSSETKSESELTQAIVTEAFNASEKTPIIDLLPSKKLATYALFNHDAAALIGSLQDLANQDKKQYSIVTFYLKSVDDEPVVIIFNNEHAKALRNDFVAGMQKIIKSGKYLQLIEKSRGKLPPEYLGRLKRLNPGWK